MMTILEATQIIGKQGLLTVEKEMRVLVTVIDVRESYGQTQYCISPVGGSGGKWVADHRVTMI